MSETSDARRLLSAAEPRRQASFRHQPAASYAIALPGTDPSRCGGASSLSVNTIPEFLSPVPRLPDNFDCRLTYCELQVHREHARSTGDVYAYRAADRAIKVIDCNLAATYRLYISPAEETAPNAMYGALHRRHLEARLTHRNLRSATARELGRALGVVNRHCQQAAFELDQRARDFADSFPTAGPSRGVLHTSNTPSPAQYAAASLPTPNWPTDFHALKEERERYRESGNSLACDLCDAAIATVADKLQQAYFNHFGQTPDWILTEPERAYEEVQNLKSRFDADPANATLRRSIATRLGHIRNFAHRKSMEFAERAHELATLSRVAPSPPPTAISDPQALSRWLRFEAVLAFTRVSLMQEQNDIPAAWAAMVDNMYFTRLEEQLARGCDPWKASRDYIRESIVMNRFDLAQQLLPAHRRLLWAMSDPALEKTSGTTRTLVPPASLFAEPQSPRASGSASLLSTVPGQPESVYCNPNRAFEPLSAEHGHAR